MPITALGGPVQTGVSGHVGGKSAPGFAQIVASGSPEAITPAGVDRDVYDAPDWIDEPDQADTAKP